MNGILPVYKPVGMTSYDVIREFKRQVKPVDKVGHGGTLDPFAEGVLLLLLGSATKKMNELSALPKTYTATAKLGASSDTLDNTGEIRKQKLEIRTLDEVQIREVAKKFVGTIEQEIPDYSATKINGVPRYKLARSGQEMERKSKRVMIYELRIMNYVGDMVTFEARVSSGTYIRQLSYDLFKSLGIESYLEKLVRVSIGEYTIDGCASTSDFSSSKWQDRVVPI